MIVLQPYEPGFPLEAFYHVRNGHPVFKVGDIHSLRYRLQAQAMQPEKTLVFDLTKASPAAQNAMLKFLEEPPGDPDIYLFHDLRWEPLETITSRATHVEPPLRLTIDEKKDIVGSAPSEFDWDRPLEDLRADLAPENGIVDELLRALAIRDPVATLAASRGFRQPEAKLLARRVRNHLFGESSPALSRTSPAVLEAWCTILENLASPGVAVRWGALEVLGS